MNPSAGMWLRLGYALRPTGLPCLALPMDQPRQAVAVVVQVEAYELGTAANDSGRELPPGVVPIGKL